MTDDWKGEYHIKRKPTKAEQYHRGQSAVQRLAHERPTAEGISADCSRITMRKRALAMTCPTANLPMWIKTYTHLRDRTGWAYAASRPRIWPT